MAKRIPIYVESTPKRAFAVAVDWPGWARGGKTADDALEALAAYASRYAGVARRARLTFPDGELAPSVFEIIERVKGGASTEFGVPGETPRADAAALTKRDVDRLTALLEAAWATWDAAAKAAEGVHLQTGPRGGGRDLQKMRGHVADAERSYLSKIGGESGKAAERLTPSEVRNSALRALAARATGAGETLDAGRRKLWAPRYYVRRSAWHSLDHAWELEDRAEKPPRGAARSKERG